ncbi:MAG: SET domain-containing protein [Pseudolabrys sp.]
MLLVKTYLDQSPIHGLGVFASETIPKGAKVWCYVEGFDRSWSPRQFAKLPKAAQEFVAYYGYRVDGEILLTVDNDHFINHSDDANTYWRDGYIRAKRTIAKGEEITNSYRLFDAAFCAAFLKDKKRPIKANGHAKNGHAKNGHTKNGHTNGRSNGHGATGGKENAGKARMMMVKAAAVRNAKSKTTRLRAAR